MFASSSELAPIEWRFSSGAVHAQLQNVLPPEDARFRVESRRATADALMRLGPKGDETLLSIVRDWRGHLAELVPP
eukprot:g9135.t1